jgi:UDP-3-O-[3-hydroxymyristoyl] glucosamine N-acyltransferase
VAGGIAVGVALGADVGIGALVGVREGAEVGVAVGVGGVVGVALGAEVDVALGVSVGGGVGVADGLLGRQPAASSPTAKALNSLRNLRREIALFIPKSIALCSSLDAESEPITA